MSRTESFVCRALRRVVLMLAALVIVLSCACCFLRPRTDWLQRHGRGYDATGIGTAILTTVR